MSYHQRNIRQIVEKFEDVTHKIIGCAMRVHSALGNGFQEVIYQRCLEVEFESEKLFFEREIEMPIHYLGRQVGTRRADFVVEEFILIELKAVIALEDVHLAQSLNYLESFGLEIGLLINFGSRSLEFKRLVAKSNSKNLSNQVNPTNPSSAFSI